jgi:hypothetical protein
MRTVFDYVGKAIAHNPWVTLWVIISAAALTFLYGCDVTTVSPVSGEKITGDQLYIESLEADASYETRRAALLSQIEQLDIEQAKANAAFGAAWDDLQAKAEQRAAIAEGLVTVVRHVAPESTANLLNVLIGALFPAGIGAVFLDNRRKDKVIAAVKNEAG